MQSFKQCPKSNRDQANNIFYFAGNATERDIIVENYATPRISKRQFEEIVDMALEATEEDTHPFMHINMRAPWKDRYRRNIDGLINYQEM
jgi:hypothetical protein